MDKSTTAHLARWPKHIPPQRYGGGGLQWTIERLALNDRHAVVDLYEAVLGLVGLQDWTVADRAASFRSLEAWMLETSWNQLRRDVAAVGPDTYAEFGSNSTLRKVVHDMRGGPMTSLALDLSLVSLGRLDDVDPTRVFLLARDVCKIMRNSFPDIDRDKYKADMALKSHSVRLLVDKWRRLESDVDVLCEYDGAIAESCIEFSALDRVLYNCMNNAIRELDGKGQRVSLSMHTDSQDPPQHLRVVVSNPISTDQSQELKHKFAGDYSPLFTTNYSTTGSGIGLQVVADFASRAYAWSTQKALEEKLLGVDVSEDCFKLWFHWPVAD
tara:strand:+ start:34 stop:1014 length:981 start_codon:yes stop_codon:yes gene_type:complete